MGSKINFAKARKTMLDQSMEREWVFSLPVASIKPNPQQPRREFNKATLTELANSIHESGGLLQPIVVQPDGNTGTYTLIAGERRLRAVRDILCEKTIRAIVQTNGDSGVGALLENIQRDNLSRWEEAQAYIGLKKSGMPVAEIIRLTGKSKGHVYELVKWGANPENEHKTQAEFRETKSDKAAPKKSVARTPPPKLKSFARQLRAFDYSFKGAALTIKFKSAAEAAALKALLSEEAP